MLIYTEYPVAFNCYDKFKRHMDKHIQECDLLIYKDDANGHIHRYVTERDLVHVCISDFNKIKPKNFDSAVIFEDPDDTSDVVTYLEEAASNFHLVPVAITKVVNKYRDSYDVYIGRGSDWGNPVAITNDVSREDAIEAFESMLQVTIDSRPDILERLEELRGKTLGCFCKPQACHGDILADYLNSTDDGK